MGTCDCTPSRGSVADRKVAAYGYEAIDSPSKDGSLQMSRNSAPFSTKFWKVCSKVEFSSDLTDQQSCFLRFHQDSILGSPLPDFPLMTAFEYSRNLLLNSL